MSYRLFLRMQSFSETQAVFEHMADAVVSEFLSTSYFWVWLAQKPTEAQMRNLVTFLPRAKDEVKTKTMKVESVWFQCAIVSWWERVWLLCNRWPLPDTQSLMCLDLLASLFSKCLWFSLSEEEIKIKGQALSYFPCVPVTQLALHSADGFDSPGIALDKCACQFHKSKCKIHKR